MRPSIRCVARGRGVVAPLVVALAPALTSCAKETFLLALVLASASISTTSVSTSGAGIDEGSKIGKLSGN